MTMNGIPATHTFGAIIFEETGETRAVAYGEAYLSIRTGVPKLCYRTFRGNRKILRPIRVEGE